MGSDGCIHFIPYSAQVGQKINTAGVPETYSLAYFTSEASAGGILMQSGDIIFTPYGAALAQKVMDTSAVPPSLPLCLSRFFNKL